MTYHDEQRRRFDEAPIERAPPPDSGMSWGLPLGVAAAFLVIGVIFFNLSHERMTTASNSGGTVQSTSSAPSTTGTAPNTSTPQNTPAQPATPPAKSQ